MKAVRFFDSPHRNTRPEGVVPDLIVLHAISLPPGSFEAEYIESFFMGKLNAAIDPRFKDLAGVRVSAHFVVDRKGKITQFVPLQSRAWHAGASSWLGRENCNDYSFGIEMIGDEKRPFTDVQYREVARLCRVLMRQFPDVSRQRIVGHQDVSPGRKWDPGKRWDWDKFYRSLSRIRNMDMQTFK